MDKKAWAFCPKLTVDIPVYVPRSRCLSCSGCPESTKTALDQLMVVPKDASEFLLRKERLKGRCPKTKGKGWCNASRSYCAYNMVCADEHARMDYRYCLVEEKMFIIKTSDGKFGSVKGAKSIKDIPFNGDVRTVYEVKKRLVLVKTLLPVSKESEGDVVIKAPDLKNTKLILATAQGMPLQPVDPAAFMKQLQERPNDFSGLIIEKTFQPSFELKVVPFEGTATPKATRKKAVKPAADE